MRSLLIFFALCLIFNGTKAETGVPQAISQSFSNRYPDAHHIKWHQNSETFIASFVQDGKRSCAYYGTDGRWLQTETRLKKHKALSNQLMQGLQKTPYSSWTVERILEVDNADGTKTTAVDVSMWTNYEIGQFEAHRLYFSANGTLIRTENR